MNERAWGEDGGRNECLHYRDLKVPTGKGARRKRNAKVTQDQTENC